MTPEILTQILTKAVHAPSGHNYQPWIFRYTKDKKLIVSLQPDADPTVYNYLERGTIIALGALTESIVLIAPIFGFEARHRFILKREQSHDVVEIVFEASNQNPTPFSSALERRFTNRKEYNRTIIPAIALDQLRQSRSGNSDIKTYIATNSETIKQISNAAVVADSLMLKDSRVREAIFPHVVWTESEERRKKEGLFLKTLELPSPAEKMFVLFYKFPIFARVLGFLGMGNIIAAQNSSRYQAGGAIALLTMTNELDVSFFNLGREMQRFWVAATYAELAAQPLGATIFLAMRARDEMPAVFSEVTKNKLERASRQIRDSFKIDSNEVSGIMMRFGYASTPSAISSRKPPEVLYE